MMKLIWQNHQNFIRCQFRKTKKIVNNWTKKLNNLVRKSICPIQIFIVNKYTKRADVYIKYYIYLNKKPEIDYEKVYLEILNIIIYYLFHF